MVCAYELMRPSATPQTNSNPRPRWLAFVSALWMAGGACTSAKFDGTRGVDSLEADAAAHASDASAATSSEADGDARADEPASELDSAASTATSDAETAAGELRDADPVAADAPDASASEEPDADASGAWIDQALGQYAMQVHAYGYDGTLVTHSRRVMLAEIERDGDAYQLVTTSCLDVATTTLATMAVQNPARLAPMRHRLLIAGETFSTEPIDKAEGFLPALPPECADKLGERVPRLPHQDWLGDTCRCGGEIAPMRDDCRVLDPDDDGNAGYTIEFKASLGGARRDLYAASVNESRLVQGGRRADDTLHALFDAKSGSAQLGCRPAGCADLSGPVAWCPKEYSSVELMPLTDDALPPGGWNCEAILARESELLPALPPPWPPGGCDR